MASYEQIGKKWQARIRKPGLNKAKNFPTLEEAKDWAVKTEAAFLEDRLQDTRPIKDVTLGSLIDLSFKKENPNKPFGKNKTAVYKRLNRTIGDVTLPKLDFDRLVEFVDMRVAEGAGGVTIGMDISYIAGLFKFGRLMRKYKLDMEIFTEVRDYMENIGLELKSKQRTRRPTQKELDDIKKHFSEKDRQQIPMSAIIDFAVATAMRASEITRIQWKDVDFEKRTVIIRDRKHPKLKKGNHQKVALLAKAWAILMAQPRTDDRVFPYECKTFSTIFPRATKALSIEDLHFHDLRHEGTSLLFEMGYDIPRVAMFTGHLDWKMLERYTQLRPEDLHPDEDGNFSWQRPLKKAEPVAAEA